MHSFTFGQALASNPAAQAWEVKLDDKTGHGFALDEGDALRLARLAFGGQDVRHQSATLLDRLPDGSVARKQVATEEDREEALDLLATLSAAEAQTASVLALQGSSEQKVLTAEEEAVLLLKAKPEATNAAIVAELKQKGLKITATDVGKLRKELEAESK